MIINFKNAFIAAFNFHKRDFVWTSDGVLRTTVMQSYIYPFIAKYLDLYLVCELPSDASLFNCDAVRNCLKTGKGFPKDPVIVIEHENNASTSDKEMKDLVKWNFMLNVIITYPIVDEPEQLTWLNNLFAPPIRKKRNQGQSFLSILPSINIGNIDMSAANWWRFYTWSDNNDSFETLT